MALKIMGTKSKMNLVDREKVLSIVEDAMSKGIQKTSIIAREAKCSHDMAGEYIKAIQERWKLRKSTDWDKMRIEQIEKSRLSEEKAWEVFEKADNSSAAIGALNTILEIQKRQAWLAGLNQILDQKNK